MTGSAVGHNGDSLYFETHGAGPSLMVFANPRAPRGPLGAPSRRLCASLVAELAGRYRLVLVDYPGRPKPDTLTPTAVTSDLLAIADAVHAETFGWWGYSWGAIIGLQLALASPRVTTLVCGGFPPMNGPYPELLELSSILLAKASRVPVLHQPLPHRIRDQLRQWVTYYSLLQDFDDVAAQARLRCQRLCFVGADDKVTLGRRQLADLGGAVQEHRPQLEAYGWDVRVLPGLNHRAAMRPDVMVPLVSTWLAEGSGRST